VITMRRRAPKNSYVKAAMVRAKARRK